MLTADIKVAEREHKSFDIPIEPWLAEKSHGISGLFRVRNEEQFLEAAVISHLKYLDQAVLVVQPSEDETLAVAKRLHMLYPSKVKLVFYPFPVHRIATPEHAAAPENSVYSMVHMTNWGISQCNFSWVAKIEGDVIGLSSFETVRQAVDTMQAGQFRHFGRVGLNIAGENFDKISFDNPRNAGWDESVFNNHPTFHCVKADKWESINLHDDRALLHNLGWSFLHTKRCKTGHKQGVEHWVPRTKENIERALREYNAQHPYPGHDNSLGEAVLYEKTILDAN